MKIDLITQFIDRYRREFDFYEKSSQLARQRLEALLESAGVRAIVTARAKKIDRLRDKLLERNMKKAYSSIEAIYDDIDSGDTYSIRRSWRMSPVRNSGVGPRHLID